MNRESNIKESKQRDTKTKIRKYERLLKVTEQEKKK